MKTRGGPDECFGVCDFCDVDSSGQHVEWVQAIGDKGICNRCAETLGKIIKEAA